MATSTDASQAEAAQPMSGFNVPSTNKTEKENEVMEKTEIYRSSMAGYRRCLERVEYRRQHGDKHGVKSWLLMAQLYRLNVVCEIGRQEVAAILERINRKEVVA